jgi:hypothetical protein
MTMRSLIPLGVVAFAITLATLLRDSLSAEGRLVAVGVALGLIVGVPVGMLAVTLAARTRVAGASQPPPAAGLALTPEQTDLLVKSLERGQASPPGFGLAAQRNRTFSAVGGADLPDTPGDGEERGSTSQP